MDRLNELLDAVVIVDTETTSKNYKEAEIIEFGSVLRENGEWKVLMEDLYKPSISIYPEISAVTHIVDEMVEHRPMFNDDNESVKQLFNLVHEASLLLVAHNAPYDKGVVANYEGFAQCEDRWLCTMRIAKRLFMEDETVKFYNLQYLRYRFKLDIPKNIDPHRASSDCIVTAKLLEFLVTEMHARNILDQAIPYKDQIIDWSKKPVFVPTMNFGKHAGQKWADIPTDYIVWAINNLDCLREDNPLYDQDMVHTLEIVMNERL